MNPEYNPKMLVRLARGNRLIFLIACIWAISGCSIDISQSAIATPASQVQSLTPLSSPTILSSDKPAQSTSNATPASTSTAPTEQIPVSWSDLNLTGKLIFTGGHVQQDNPILNIQSLDLATGDLSTIFQTSGQAWLYYMSASAVNGQILISYSAPPGNNLPAGQALYILPLDGSKVPQLLVTPPSPDDQYLQAEWSPDGRYIYFVHMNDKPQFAGQVFPIYEIFRMPYPGGQPEKIADKAFWPRLSSDSSQLVYVSSDPSDGKNKIFVANADGSDAHQLLLTGPQIPDVIDAPIFSPDGKSILFSAPPPALADQPSWLDRLFGIQVAEAHAIPSDWWSVPVSGGIPKRLTHVESPALFASLSPDGKYYASYSGLGLFVMKPDGTGEAVIIPDLGGIAGMVSWLP